MLDRRYALGRIHSLAKKLGWDEDTYRDFLERETEQRSCRDLSDAQLERVLHSLAGYSQCRKPHPGDYSPKYPAHSRQSKLVALWCECNRLGLLRSDGGHAALTEYLWRGHEKPANLLPGVDLLLAAPDELLFNRIEGLNALLIRNNQPTKRKPCKQRG